MATLIKRKGRKLLTSGPIEVNSIDLVMVGLAERQHFELVLGCGDNQYIMRVERSVGEKLGLKWNLPQGA